jgi:hypothetical protein
MIELSFMGLVAIPAGLGLIGPRHSERAAARFSLNMVREERLRSVLKWL